MAGGEVGTYTLPVILSFEGVDKQVNSKLGKVFGDVGKKASKSLGDGAKAAAADVDKLAASYSKLRDKAEDALGKVRGDEAALQKLRDSGASDDRIVRAEEKLATSRRNSSRAIREATGAHDDLKRAQSSLGDENDRLSGKFNRLGDFAGVAGKAITGAGVVAAGAAVVGVGALAAGVVLAGKALYDLGAEFDDVFDNIRVKTGATGPQLEALQSATERLSTKVPLSIGEIGNVVAETSRALHLVGPDLDNTSKAIANLGRLTGENIDVRTLGKAFRGFGVDAKDQVPALDSLLRASQTTGVGVNELLSTVVKGGAGLRQFGFTFGESAALATQFEEAGLDADKAMGGLTKGLAALAKDGQTGQDALRGNVDQIKSLVAAGNDAGALDLTNKLFGAKGGVQFFEAIKNGALDLDTLADSMANTGDTIAQAASDTDDWAERWQVFKNSLKVGFQPIATGVFDAVNDKLTELADWVDKHKPEVIGFFGELAATITEKTAEALRGISSFISDGLVPILRAVEDFGKNNVLANLIPGAEELGGAAGILADGLEKIPDKLNAAADATDSWVPKIRSLTERTADAQRFVGALGEATASLPDGKTIKLSSNAPETVEALDALGITVTTLPDGTIGVTANTAEGERIIQAFRDQETKAPITPWIKPRLETNGLDVSIGNYFKNLRPTITPQINAPGPWHTTEGNTPPPPGGFTPTPHRAAGGPVFGAGNATSDSIPAWLSNGEHVWTAKEVAAVGGQNAMYQMRAAALAGYAGGGRIMPLGLSIDGSGDGRTRRNAGPGSRVRDHRPGNNPNEIGIPDWSVPGQGFGPAPDWWWTRPIDPNDVLFPDDTPWGQNPWGIKHPFAKKGIAALSGFADGGAVGPDVMVAGELVGTAYSKAKRNDCSGMVARVIDRTLGLPETGLMSTKNAAEWLAARGFKPGIGGPGAISVGWYDHGPNPNDGHMAMTLSDGTNAESGGGVGDIFQIGGGAAGASDPQFDQHMFLPTLYGEGESGSSSASGYSYSSGGGGGGGGTPGVGPNGEAGSYSAPDAKDVREANQKVADADQRVREAEAKQKELEADAKESQKISAQADVDKAKREAADARADRDDTLKGKFAAGKGGKGGAGDLSPLGSIFGSFLKETTGLDGSLFPDIGNLAPVQMLGTLLGAFGGAGGDPTAAGATSTSPFGLPDIAVPPPAGSAASGAGFGPAPGPAAPNITIDQSVHGNVGASFDEVQKKRDAGLSRAVQRIPVGS